MASAAPEENLNAHGKESAEITHAERMLSGDDSKQPQEHGLTQAQIRKFMIKMDWRVLPMLGVIYAISIIDRINVSTSPMALRTYHHTSFYPVTSSN